MARIRRYSPAGRLEAVRLEKWARLEGFRWPELVHELADRGLVVLHGGQVIACVECSGELELRTGPTEPTPRARPHLALARPARAD